MLRIDAPEILDSDACSSADVEISMRDLGRVNRWFGGVATSQKMVERVAQAAGAKCLTLLEVASGSGEVPLKVQRKLARHGITLEVTLLDRSRSHLPNGNRRPQERAVVADALDLPFGDGAFDLVSCSLFAHHLNVELLTQFVREGLRVSQRALLINDLIRHPLHLALVYAGFPIMRSRVAWLDGLTSVRRAYIPDEIRSVLAAAVSNDVRTEISSNYLYRMGVIVWKNAA
jgi:hypothetical protein